MCSMRPAGLNGVLPDVMCRGNARAAASAKRALPAGGPSNKKVGKRSRFSQDDSVLLARWVRPADNAKCVSPATLLTPSFFIRVLR